MMLGIDFLGQLFVREMKIVVVWCARRICLNSSHSLPARFGCARPGRDEVRKNDCCFSATCFALPASCLFNYAEIISAVAQIYKTTVTIVVEKLSGSSPRPRMEQLRKTISGYGRVAGFCGTTLRDVVPALIGL